MGAMDCALAAEATRLQSYKRRATGTPSVGGGSGARRQARVPRVAGARPPRPWRRQRGTAHLAAALVAALVAACSSAAAPHSLLARSAATCARGGGGRRGAGGGAEAVVGGPGRARMRRAAAASAARPGARHPTHLERARPPRVAAAADVAWAQAGSDQGRARCREKAAAAPAVTQPSAPPAAAVVPLRPVPPPSPARPTCGRQEGVLAGRAAAAVGIGLGVDLAGVDGRQQRREDGPAVGGRGRGGARGAGWWARGPRAGLRRVRGMAQGRGQRGVRGVRRGPPTMPRAARLCARSAAGRRGCSPG
jgi:hypothetical protein